MPTSTISAVASIGGLSISSSISRTASGQIGQEDSLPAGNAGSLSTRTDDNTGVATLAAGHTIESADVVDVFWVGGSRYGMTATVSTNDVTVDGGAGDNLPAEDTAVIVTQQVELDVDFAGDKVEMFAAKCSTRARVTFKTSAPANIASADLAAAEHWHWSADTGVTNPLAGQTVASVAVSNGDSTAAGTIQLGILYNSDT